MQPTGGTADVQAQAGGAGEAQPGDMHRHGHAHDPMARGGARGCPMAVPGTDVTVENTERGATLTFTTDRPEDVEALRARVHGMAARHERRMREGGEGRGGEGRGPGPMPPATASVTDVPNGARLELTARHPEDVAAVQQHAAMRAEHLATCPMRGQRPPA